MGTGTEVYKSIGSDRQLFSGSPVSLLPHGPQWPAHGTIVPEEDKAVN